MANRMSLFYAEATPMLKTLSNATTKFVSEVKVLFTSNQTSSYTVWSEAHPSLHWQTISVAEITQSHQRFLQHLQEVELMVSTLRP